MKKSYIKPEIELSILLEENGLICESQVDIVDDGEGGYEGEWDTKEERHMDEKESGSSGGSLWDKGWNM